MPPKLDLVNQKFNRLFVIEEAGRDKWGKVLWKCQCDCGTKTIVLGRNLKNGNTKSCGCLHVEKTIGRNKQGNSKETREKISKSKIGKKCPEHSERMKGKMKGKNHPNYNPKLTNGERQDRRKYFEYYEWLTAVYKRDNYICQYCGKRGGKLNAHHLESYRDNPELRTTLENGITLCEKCHKNFHHQYGYGNNTKEQFEEFLMQELKFCI